MKKIFYLAIAIAFNTFLFGQAPENFSYQAVVRTADGNLIKNTEVSLKISILAGSAAGTAVCVEEFTPTTNDHGLVTLQIGSVNPTDFQNVDWSYQDYFVKIELDPAGGTDYTEMGTSQLLSVPYALYAKNAGENLYFKDNKIGIGTNNPSRPLTINSKTQNSYIAYQTTSTGSTNSDGFLTGLQDGTFDSYLWNYEDGDMFFGTNNASRMIITKEGNVGIGTTSPAANVHVNGTAKFGNSGVVFQEMREITGVTSGTDYYTVITLPSGYAEGNTRILSAEVNYNGDRWTGLGNDNMNGSNNSISYIINAGYLYLYVPDMSIYKNKSFRILLLKISIP